MNKTLSDWFYVIRNCSVVGTYKMAWAKAIVECCLEKQQLDVLSFNDISPKIFKYYWNQTIFFDLQQGSNPKKPLEFISYVKQKIEEYQNQKGFQPIMFERIENKTKLDFNKMSRILKQDVSHRFLVVSGKNFPLYKLDKNKMIINCLDVDTIKTYSDLLFEIINYKWAQILETYNSSPRISQKIKITDRGGVKRKTLTRFKKYLDLDSDVCFICGGNFEPKQKSIDHMIPWSYMFSDDLWNLVYVHKKCNSSKSNKIVDDLIIKKLNERNYRLHKLMIEQGMQNDKHFKELELAIENQYVRKFWISFKG